MLGDTEHRAHNIPNIMAPGSDIFYCIAKKIKSLISNSQLVAQAWQSLSSESSGWSLSSESLENFQCSWKAELVSAMQKNLLLDS